MRQITFAFCSFVGFCSTLPALAQNPSALHDSLITFDAEIDIPFDFMEENKDAGQETTMQVDLPKMDRGGLDGALFVSSVSQEKRTPDAYEKANKDAEIKFSAIEKMIATYPDRIGLAKSADEAEQLVKLGKHFAVIGMVNAWPLGPNLSLLPELHRRGLASITLNHAGHNQFSDSSRPRAILGDQKYEHLGLSRLGRALIRSMNKLGIIVDVSQVTRQTVFQAAELSIAPIIASHSGISAIVDTARNLTDPEMLAIKETGGGVGIVAFSNYLRAPTAAQRRAYTAIIEEFGTSNLTEITASSPIESINKFKVDYAKYERNFPLATVSQYVDSIDYAVALLGINHVFISSDMEHGGGVRGWKDAGEAFGLTNELFDRGYSEDQIAKLWWGNFARIWRAVEASTVQ